MNSRDESWLREVFRILLRRKQADFSLYRRTSILRAIASRMNYLNLQDPSSYARHLSVDPSEVEKLYERILIKTTSFFRDPGAFDALKRQVLHPMVRARSVLAPIRVWVVGCSTGEEVYSVAMSLIECADVAHKKIPFQILATDVSEVALQKARVGEYSDRMVAGVSSDRLKRFFTRTAGGYRINREVRGSCIFARHNLVQTVPFCRMDLVTCRNVLIYMEPALQKRALAKLHFALRPGGVLMLGSSERIPRCAEWNPLNDKARIYKRR